MNGSDVSVFGDDEEFFHNAIKDCFGGIDPWVPQSARVWNRWLGGKDCFPVDRQAADRYARIFPGIVDVARHSRMFLARAVRHLAGVEGVRQFLDIGVGMPAPTDNTHQIAQRIAPESRIVYVDNDPLPLIFAHGLLISRPEGACAYLDADLRDPEKILREAAGTLDFGQPIALILVEVLGHITDDAQARDILSQLAAGLPHGSFLVIADGVTTLPAALAWAQEDYNHTAQPYELRDAPRLARLLDGLDLLPPGLVGCCDWRPEVAALAPAPAVEPLAAIARTHTRPGVPE